MTKKFMDLSNQNALLEITGTTYNFNQTEFSW